MVPKGWGAEVTQDIGKPAHMHPACQSHNYMHTALVRLRYHNDASAGLLALALA
jgi:hypothetical protein